MNGMWPGLPIPIIPPVNKPNACSIIMIITIIISILLITLAVCIIFKSIRQNQSLRSSTILLDATEKKVGSVADTDVGQKALIAAADRYSGLFQWSNYKQINLLNKTCTAKVKSRISINGVWDGRFECDGVVGTSEHSSGRRNAVKSAIQDYLIQSGQVGLVTDEQLQLLV